MIVMKFGGTSVDGAARLAAVARIVASRLAERPVVVTSAMAGVTNALEGLMAVALRGDKAAMELEVAKLGERHREAAQQIARHDDALIARLEERLKDLRVLLRGARLLGTATPRSLDQVLGFGELLAQELLGAALGQCGAPATVVDAREVVITDDRFGAARPLADETRERSATLVRPLVDRGRIPVLGGYLGATADGIPTTLGRGGSDLSASVLGLALGAAAVEIFTDVDGLMTADPRVVPHAAVLRAVTFREAAELAHYGAKVLHPAAIDPAIQGGLPVRVRNSLRPEGGGTAIGPSRTGESGVRSIAARPRVALAGLRAPGRWRSPGFLAETMGALGAAGVQPLGLLCGPVWLEAIVPDEGGVDAIVDAWRPAGRVEATRGLALVGAVGEGLAEAPQLWSGLVARAAAFPVRRVVQGPHGSSLGLLLPEERASDLVRLWHGAIFERSAVGGA